MVGDDCLSCTRDCGNCELPDALERERLRQLRIQKIEKAYQESKTNGSMNRPGGDKFDGLD